MFEGRYIFSQILDFIPRRLFDECVEKYNGNSRVKRLSCRDQFLSLVFGQLTGLQSLRGISLCLNAHKDQLYHLGFRTKSFILSTISRANQFRDWRMWHDFTEYLILKARKLYVTDNDFSCEFFGSVGV